MSFPENLDVFFSSREFADEVTRPDDSKFLAIFDETYFDPNIGETVIDTTQPRLTCKLSDLTGITRKSKLSIKGKSYTVIKIQPDGTGTASVLLSHQTADD